MFILQLFKWILNLNKEWWHNCPFIMLGGDQPEPPSAPPVQNFEETSQEAIQAQIDATPQILATQKEFGPQFTQLDLDQIKQFGPQFAEELLSLQEQFGPRTAAALREEQRALSPELALAQDELAGFFGQEGELSPQEERQFLQDQRASQGVRGFALESGVGAEAELEGLTRLRQDLKTRRLNIALSTAGRVPVQGISQQQQGQFGPGQLVSNVNPNQAFGYNTSIFGTQAGMAANIFGTQSSAASAQRGQNIGLIGAGIGAAGTIGGASKFITGGN